MKKLLFYTLLVFIALLTTCAWQERNEDFAMETEQEYDGVPLQNDFDYTDYEAVGSLQDDYSEPLMLSAFYELPWDEAGFTPENAVYYFRRLQALWDEDGGEMWGRPLHMPVVFVCEDTHIAIANRQRDESATITPFTRHYVDGFAVYVGTHTPPRYYEYRFWDEQQGVLQNWQALRRSASHLGPVTVYSWRRPDYDDYDAILYRQSLAVLMLMNHSAFHIHVRRGVRPIVCNYEMRISYMLEVIALIEAINGASDTRLESLRDALSIRQARWEAFETVPCLFGGQYRNLAHEETIA